jgi:hypothetical protein
LDTKKSFVPEIRNLAFPEPRLFYCRFLKMVRSEDVAC